MSGEFYQHYQGRFENILRWNMLDELWERIRKQSSEAWYIYAVGETPPDKPLESVQLLSFIDEIDDLLRRDHDEDYCGIVYVDNRNAPGMIKIFDPNNLGSSCGSSGYSILPGWVLSHVKPANLVDSPIVIPANRKRWWQRIFSR